LREDERDRVDERVVERDALAARHYRQQNTERDESE
jgi:hypothetical protein